MVTMAKSSETGLKSFPFRKLHSNILIGTASDRYAGWIGLIDEVLGSPSLTRRTIRETVKGRLVQNVSVSDFDRFVDYEKIFGKGRPIDKRSRL
jgi:hypothetical protein